MRKKRQPQVSRSARGRADRLRRSATGRLAWRRSIAVLVPLGLLLLTLLASSGQARPAAEATPEAEALALSERAALREERQLARRAKHESKWATGGERNNVVVKTSCTSVTWEYRNFPDLPGNTVTQKITINGVSTFAKYVFDGPTSKTVTNFNAPPGQYKIDARGKWKTNGVNGTFDIGISVRCASAPGFAVEKLQQIEGAGGSFTIGALTGDVGQTIDYEFIVRNTGNVPMTFGTFSDARCDEGTISGGPGAEAVPAGGSSTYLCKHLLTAADETAGTVTNSVAITGSPPEGEGPPIEETSNTVVVGVLPPEPAPEPPAPKPGSNNRDALLGRSRLHDHPDAPVGRARVGPVDRCPRAENERPEAERPAGMRA